MAQTASEALENVNSRIRAAGQTRPNVKPSEPPIPRRLNETSAIDHGSLVDPARDLPWPRSSRGPGMAASRAGRHKPISGFPEGSSRIHEGCTGRGNAARQGRDGGEAEGCADDRGRVLRLYPEQKRGH